MKNRYVVGVFDGDIITIEGEDVRSYDYEAAKGDADLRNKLDNGTHNKVYKLVEVKSKKRG